ncbi:isochorismatase family protein [Streptomyces sp. CA-106110]|uniref:isochorismatase family protein n=1 Tax=Streptomyces sp. CA-106110 TaxID=3240044 RepID=UPI003D8A3DE5
MHRHSGHIGYVRLGFEDSDYDAIPPTNSRFSAVAAGRYLHAASADTAIHPEVAPDPAASSYARRRSAPSPPPTSIRSCAAAVAPSSSPACTPEGSLSTVRDAADRDFRLVVVEDCTADPEREVHDMLMGKILSHQATVITSERLDDLLTTC